MADSESLKQKAVFIIKRFKKISLFFLGCCLVLFTLEAGLQVSSFIAHRFFLPQYDFPKIHTANTRIIFCLGDSFTYGIGAGFNHSYPAQLEEILNQRSKGLNFKVYNLGVPGYNSTQVANRLRTVVTSCKPDAVVVLCGCNDNWNFRDMKWHWNWGTLAVDSLLSKLRVYRMATVFFQNMRQSGVNPVKHDSLPAVRKILVKGNDEQKLVAYANIYRDAGYYEQAKVFYEKSLFLKPSSRVALMELGRCYKLNREYNRAVETFGGMLKNNVDDSPVYEELDDVFRRLNVIEEPIAFYTALLKKFPGNKQIRRRLSKTYVHLGGTLYKNGQVDEAYCLYSDAVILDPENKKAQKLLETMRIFRELRGTNKNSILSLSPFDILKFVEGYLIIKIMPIKKITDDLLIENLSAMAALCREKEIPLIFSGYPREIPEKIKELALQDNIPLVEHERCFARLLAAAPLEVYFISEDDPHCTRLGYRVMAENIAEAVLETIDFIQKGL
ncbi:MAG: hypothetical protein KJ893_09720 [Candidatus Omnitrophica bacterium]|nr:hypothetical protein [Candidatus Omnitrophota bacterium]MBU4479259.1 hypothetical protein [Candidatus Omnitrophota bacterium]MCG2703065.1 GDSL-type esterase/lipase family protein [Candidatus Omnitrophota bacterium]